MFYDSFYKQVDPTWPVNYPPRPDTNTTEQDPLPTPPIYIYIWIISNKKG